MTEHLPECHQPKYLNQVMWGSISRDEPFVPCICDALRACEERVSDAAVQRVEALCSLDPSWDGTNWNNALHAAIAAIKGDQR